MDSNSSIPAIADSFLTHAKILAQLVAIAWALFMVDTLLGGSIKRLGIRPRTFSGLLCIPLSVFLHGNANHLIGNTSFFLVLGSVLMLRGLADFAIVSLVVMAVDGLGTWLLGRDANHIGASGVLFGYLGFLLLRGYFENSILSALATILMGAFYTRLLWGIFPTSSGSSWEGHLFGFIGGAVVARYLETIKAMLPTGLF